MTSIPQNLTTALAAHADRADADAVWPADSWATLRQTGALRWAIPTAWGGDGLHGVELLQRYRDLATVCLTSCFILSQRDAACRRIQGSANTALCERVLPALAAGDAFATVGISQLTTARQHTGPSFTALLEGDALVLDGVIPWVTGAAAAQHLVVGAVLDNGLQVLAILPTALAGVHVGAPLELLALRGSLTAEVRCERVRVGTDWLLAGPTERVLDTGRGGAGGLETSCLALGLVDASLVFLEHEAEQRTALLPVCRQLRARFDRCWHELARLANGSGTPAEASTLRGKANVLVLHATQAALTAAKGTGFVRPHSAQRWARQALFFLVWSCPWPAASALLDSLSEPDCPIG